VKKTFSARFLGILLGTALAAASDRAQAATPPIFSAITRSGFSHNDLAPHEWKRTVSNLLQRLFPGALVRESAEMVTMHLWEPMLKNGKILSPVQTIEFSVIEDLNANAFALAAHPEEGLAAQVKITRPLFDVVQNESELAFVISHEVSHIRHDHFSVQFPASMLTSSQRDRITRTHQRWELTADEEAVARMRGSNFDQLSSLEILDRLSERSAFLKTSCLHNHPALEERLENIKTSLLDQPVFGFETAPALHDR